MRRKFEYWLKEFKEYKTGKANSCLSALDAISLKMLAQEMISNSIYNCDSFIKFAKIRKSYISAFEITTQEKKPLELYGDFLQFVELTHYAFPEAKHPLVEYCEDLKMAYSYKPVLIRSLVNLQKEGQPLSFDAIVNCFISFYETRLHNGLVAEKENSLFASTPIDHKSAEKIVKENPLAVLIKDGIIVFDEASNIVSFAPKYSPSDTSCDEVIDLCEKKLDTYYQKIATNKKVDVEIIHSALGNLINEISNEHDEKLRNESLQLIEQLSALWDKKQATTITQGNGGKAYSTHTELALLDESDPRSIGKLVKESMEAIEAAGFSFSANEIAQFTSNDWSKTVLHIYYPFMRKYDSSKELSEQKKDYLGNNRYWNRVFTFGEEQYLITSEWYKGDKPYFINWYNRFLEGIK